jgi:hypothetical protein
VDRADVAREFAGDRRLADAGEAVDQDQTEVVDTD